MFDRARSGQVLPFCLVSAISGNAVTGASGAISGRKVIDGGVQALLSGNVIETSGGTYRANLHTEDVDGNIIGYYFTASGCIPVHYTVVTQQNVSGRVYPASGVFVNATATVTSGTVFLASGHFLFGSGQFYLNSGQRVNVFSGQLSGHAVDLLSGRSYTASGIFATAAATIASGALSGQQVTALSVLDKSGYTVGVNLDKSGYTAGLLSGVNYFASGHHAVVPPVSLSGVVANSGLFVSVPIASISGVNAVATATLTSGQVFLASGTPVVAAVVNDKSGYTLHSSGLDTVIVETGMNARQALAAIAASVAGRLSGAGTAVVRIDGANVSGTNRIAAQVDSSGNRMSVILNLPG